MFRFSSGAKTVGAGFPRPPSTYNVHILYWKLLSILDFKPKYCFGQVFLTEVMLFSEFSCRKRKSRKILTESVECAKMIIKSITLLGNEARICQFFLRHCGHSTMDKIWTFITNRKNAPAQKDCLTQEEMSTLHAVIKGNCRWDMGETL